MIRIARVVLLTSLVAAASWAQAADTWRVVDDDSRIGFVATYDDIPFDARFRSFEAGIRFSPDDLDGSSFDVRIDVSSVDSNSGDRDEGMKTQEWFAAETHPTATFTAEKFRQLSEDRYAAVGELTLKDVSKTLEVPFTWASQPEGGAILTAETVVKRGDFNIGTGEWAEDDVIGFDVTVKAKLVLKPSKD